MNKVTNDTQYVHFRYRDDYGVINPIGGATVAYIVLGSGDFVVGAPAICSAPDNFIKSVGRKIALDNLVERKLMMVTGLDEIKSVIINRASMFKFAYPGLTMRANDRIHDLVMQQIEAELDQQPAALISSSMYESLIERQVRLEINQKTKIGRSMKTMVQYYDES